MRYTRIFSLAVVSVIVVSLSGPACESACGDSAPQQGDSCSGTATCGQTCGTIWACKGGTWDVAIEDCYYPGSPGPLDAGSSDSSDGDADTGSDADADAPCDAPGDDDAEPIPLH